jgi:hypothetical protein
MTSTRVILIAFIALLAALSPTKCRAWTTTTNVRGNRLFSTSAERKTGLGSTDATTTTTAIRDECVQEVLQLAREFGPVGQRQSAENQQMLLDAALKLMDFSDPAPAKLALSGIHYLLYSAAPGGSSGKLGPWDGAVTQEFVDDSTFINAVQLGPVTIALTASRQIKSDTIIAVKFHKTTVSVFGVQLFEKEIGGGGSWKMLFAGRVQDRDGTEKLVRVIQTPSLFVIEQPVVE